MNTEEERQLLAELGSDLRPELNPDPSPDRVAAVRAAAEARRTELARQQEAPSGPFGDENPVPVFSAQQAQPFDAGPDELDRWPDDEVAERRRGRRSVLVGGAAATVGLAAGIAAGRTVLASDDEGPSVAREGPKTEPITFTGGQPEVSSDAKLINHTWGTELLLDIEGLPDGADYQVVYVANNEDLASGGSFKAVADTLMKCRFNSSLLRTQTASIQLRNIEGEVVMESDLS